MIGYLDTSAFIPLLVAEPSSSACATFWNAADDLASTRIMNVEAVAALAQAHRMHRLEARQHTASRKLLDLLWQQLDVIELDDPLVRHAGLLAESHALRGYDATHCAAAAALESPDTVAATGDQRLLAAWKSLGIATFDINNPDPDH